MIKCVINDYLQIKQQASIGFQSFITHYREDPDQQNLIDWIQEDWVSYDTFLFANPAQRYVDLFTIIF